MKKFICALSFFSLLAITSSSKAQSLSDIFNKKNVSKVVSAVTDQDSKKWNIVGTWSYEGSAVKLNSSNVIKNVGGKLATSTIEDNLDKQFAKVGIQKGISTFNFQSDSIFTVTLREKTQQGKYSLDLENKKIDLTFFGRAGITANIDVSENEMTLTFDSDKLIDVVSYISKIANNSSLNALNSVLGSYDGVMTGFVLTRKE